MPFLIMSTAKDAKLRCKVWEIKSKIWDKLSEEQISNQVSSAEKNIGIECDQSVKLYNDFDILDMMATKETHV